MHLYNNSLQIINFNAAASVAAQHVYYSKFLSSKGLVIAKHIFCGKLLEAGVDIDAENNEKLARKFVSEQESKNGSMQKKTKNF